MTNVSTTVANDIDNADDKIRYDQQVKKVLANRPILSRILKHTVNELREYSLEIIESCISKNIDISSVYVNPGESNTKIVSDETNDKFDGEGKIIYDIKFFITTPHGEQRKIIINIEAQQKSNPGYDIVTRAIFYCSRLISSQLTVEFNNNGSDNTNYDDIKKVYTIWICMDCPKNKQDSIISFNWQPNIIHQGKNNLSVDYRYDIMNVVIIHLSEIGSESKDKLVDMLDTLLDTSIKLEDKKKRLSDIHGIAMSVEMDREVTDMCNLSSGIEARGEARGKKKGILKTLASLIKKGRLTVEEAAEEAGMSIAEFNKAIAAL